MEHVQVLHKRESRVGPGVPLFGGFARMLFQTTWATRKFVPFVMQRISVAVQIAAATEIRQALGRGMGPDSA